MRPLLLIKYKIVVKSLFEDIESNRLEELIMISKKAVKVFNYLLVNLVCIKLDII